MATLIQHARQDRTCNQRIRNPLLYPLSYGRSDFASLFVILLCVGPFRQGGSVNRPNVAANVTFPGFAPAVAGCCAQGRRPLRQRQDRRSTPL